MTQGHDRLTALQPKGNSTITYRPIAPSSAPQKILPRPETFDDDKRKWSSTFQDSEHSPILSKRRTSNSSLGSTENVSSAADQRTRRKEQNRAAQRAFRERKERYVKELEDKIKQIEVDHAIRIAQLEKENTDLISTLKSIQGELARLKGGQAGQTTSPPYSEAQSPSNSTNSTPKISPSARTIPRVPSSAVACIRDKDGVSFCERLKEEVCSNAFDRLLTEPLFDSHGFLNETVSNDPVPIVTFTGKQHKMSEVFNKLEQSLTENFVSEKEADYDCTDLISCSQAWQRIAKHPMFDRFNVDELCDELRRRAKCSRTGPVFEEYEVKEVLDLMVNRVSLDKKKDP